MIAVARTVYNEFCQLLRVLLSSYAEIFFLQSKWLGLCICLLTFLHPHIGAAGIISVIAAYLFSYVLGINNKFLESGYYTYNPLLVGLSLGYLFKLSALSIFLFSICGIFTFMVTLSIAHILYQFFGLPILSVPFVFVSSLVYLAYGKFTNLLVNFYTPIDAKYMCFECPLFLKGFLQSMGAIFFYPYEVLGAVLALLILLRSRWLFILGILGYLTGATVSGLLVGSIPQAFADTTGFNYILISMAIGGVFLVPGKKSIFISLVGVATAAIILHSAKIIFVWFNLPVFTLPFNLVTLIFIYVFKLINYRLHPAIYRGTPEKTLEYHLFNSRRFSDEYKVLRFPFSGRWSVWQGFDGQWTHQGNWKYAMDFVLKDQKGQLFSGAGKKLQDYYAFGKPVLAPVRGRVIKVVAHEQDNVPGALELENNWGNYVMIESEQKFIVQICHFKQNSISVKPGAWVEEGTFIGLCGNSGYSPQPHIHIQVQWESNTNAYTIPFSFASYYLEKEAGLSYISNGVPELDSTVEPLVPSPVWKRAISFILDKKYQYKVSNASTSHCEMQAKIENGIHYLAEGKNKLYYGQAKGAFYFYTYQGCFHSPMKYLFLLFPKLPLTDKSPLVWEESLPLSLALPWYRRILIELILPIFPHAVELKGFYQKNDMQIKGVIKLNQSTLFTIEGVFSQDACIENMQIKDHKGNTMIFQKELVD